MNNNNDRGRLSRSLSPLPRLLSLSPLRRGNNDDDVPLGSRDHRNAASSGSGLDSESRHHSRGDEND